MRVIERCGAWGEIRRFELWWDLGTSRYYWSQASVEMLILFVDKEKQKQKRVTWWRDDEFDDHMFDETSRNSLRCSISKQFLSGKILPSRMQVFFFFAFFRSYLHTVHCFLQRGIRKMQNRHHVTTFFECANCKPTARETAEWNIHFKGRLGSIVQEFDWKSKTKNESTCSL